MFHTLKLQSIPFKTGFDSLVPVVVPHINDNGDPVNSIEFRPFDNPLDGAHYDPQLHSLRAMVNLGVHLNPVSFGQIENDPNHLRKAAQRSIDSIVSSIKSRQVPHGELSVELSVEKSVEQSK